MSRSFCFSCFFTSIALALTGCAGSPNSPVINTTPPPQSQASSTTFIYVHVVGGITALGNPGTDEVDGYVLQNGQFSHIGKPGLPVLFRTTDMAVSPHDKALYVIDGGLKTPCSSNLHVYSINDKGELAEIADNVFPVCVNSGPMVIDQSGKFLFVPAHDGLHEFAIDPDTDQLSEMTGSPFAVGGVQFALSAVLSGQYLYVSRPSDTWAFRLDPVTGDLTDLHRNPVILFNGEVCDTDSSGQFLYAYYATPPYGNRMTFRIRSNGQLELLRNNQNDEILWFFPFDSLSNTVRPACCAGRLPGLEVLKPDPADGSLHPVSGSPFNLGDGLGVASVFEDEAQRVIYVATEQAVCAFSLNPDGSPRMPPLAHVDVVDSDIYSIAKVVLAHQKPGQ